MLRGGIVVVVVGRLGEYDGGAGERLLSGDTDLLVLTLLVVELLLLIRVVLGSTRMRCWMLMSIVILMGSHSTAKKELHYLLFLFRGSIDLVDLILLTVEVSRSHSVRHTTHLWTSDSPVAKTST
jgi:hypothetical protein